MGEHGGVLSITSKDRRALDLPPAPDGGVLHKAYEAGRWQKLWVSTVGRGRGFIAYNLYGTPGGNQCPAARAATTAMLQATLEDAAVHHTEPVIVLGDFNLSPHMCPLIQAGLRPGFGGILMTPST